MSLSGCRSRILHFFGRKLNVVWLGVCVALAVTAVALGLLGIGSIDGRGAKTHGGPLFPVNAGTVGKPSYGFIDSHGRWVIKPRFEDAWDFADGLAPVEVADKWGYADESGRLVIRPQFTTASYFYRGLARVGVGIAVPEDGALGIVPRTYGFIDETGKMVIPAVWDDAGQFLLDVVPVKQGQSWGLLDSQGHLAVPLTFESIGPFSDELAYAEQGDKWGFIDMTGAWVIPPQYEYPAIQATVTDSLGTRVMLGANTSVAVTVFSGGRAAAVMADGKWQYIDTSGSAVFQQAYQAAGPFSEGLAAVEVDGKWGFINATGTMAIKPQFESDAAISDFFYTTGRGGFHQGLARVIMNGKTGYIDTTGSFVIPPTLKTGDMFFHGLARVEDGDSYEMLIDMTGKVIYRSAAPSQQTTSSTSIGELQTGPDSPFHKWGETAKFDGISVTVSRPKAGTLDTSQTAEFGPEPTSPGDRVIEALVRITNGSQQTLTQDTEDSFFFQAYDSTGTDYSRDSQTTVDPGFPVGDIAPGKAATGYDSWMVQQGRNIVRIEFSMRLANGEQITEIWGD